MTDFDSGRFSALIWDLRQCAFKTALPEKLNHITETLVNNPPIRRNVYPLGNRWVIKYYFAGAQRVFASPSDKTEAFRLADMIISAFSKLRHSRFVPTEDSFNYTPAQAATDLTAEKEIADLLVQIRCLAPQREPGEPQSRRTARGEFMAMQAQLTGIQQELAEIKSLLAR